MYLSFGEAKIFYTSKGSEKPLVLLHGFLESSKIWNRLIAETKLQRQIICIDLPGHGRSGCINEVHSMDLMAEVVFAVLKEMRIEKADFMGHSMGGYVCMALLEHHPEIFRKIILLNSTPAADSEEKKQIRNRSEALVQQNKSAFIRMAISNLLAPQNKDRFQKEMNSLKNEALQFPAEGIIAALKGMKDRPDRKNILKSFSYNKYIITGKTDPLLDFKEIKNISSYCGTQLFSFPSGHLSYIESFDEFLKVVYFIE